MDDDAIISYYSQSALRIPAQTKCIRLLHVHAPLGSEGPDGSIRCNISVVDLTLQPSYTAISYVWGIKAPQPDTISCDGRELPVTRNCLSALRHLRANRGAFTIWIDAICINQLDKTEQAQQISLMGDIYSGAVTTYFWLGEGSPEKDRAMQYLSRAGFLQYYTVSGAETEDRNINHRPLAAVFHYWIYRWTYKKTPVPWDKTAIPISRRCRTDGGPGPSMQDVDELLNSPWTTRIWTYQEAVLARNPIVVCGKSHIQWDQFAYSMVFLSSLNNVKNLHRWMDIVAHRAICQQELGQNDFSLGHITKYWKFCLTIRLYQRRLGKIFLWGFVVICLYTLPIVLAVELSWSNMGGSKTMLWLLTIPPGTISAFFFLRTYGLPLRIAPGGAMSLNKELRIPDAEGTDVGKLLLETLALRTATDTRDMSFGLHTVLQRFTYGRIGVPAVDYSIPPREVYRQLTRYIFDVSQSLNLLLLAASRRCSEGPSWVPDYSKHLKIFEGSVEDPALGSKASDDSLPYHRLEDDGFTLVVKGFCHDEVATIAQFHQTASQHTSSDNDIHKKNLVLLVDWCHKFSELFRNPKYVLSKILRCSPWGLSPFPALLARRILASASPPITPSELEAYLHLLSPVFPNRFFPQPHTSKYSEKVKYVADQAWASMTQGGIFSDHRLLQTHIRVCNTLSRANMRLFTTKKDHFGFSFGDLQENDLVYLISGLPLPLLMRESGSRVQLISICYFAPEIYRSSWYRDIQLPTVFDYACGWWKYTTKFIARTGAQGPVNDGHIWRKYVKHTIAWNIERCSPIHDGHVWREYVKERRKATGTASNVQQGDSDAHGQVAPLETNNSLESVLDDIYIS